jgi:AcrR family transcriptional regulator
VPAHATIPTNDELRRSLNASRDPRVTQTREAIIGAASALAKTDNEPITVSNIVRTSGVSRSAFYAHFGSLDDLAVFIQTRTFEQIAIEERSPEGFTPNATLRLSLERLVQHFAQHRPLYAAALSLSTSRRVHERAASALAELTRGYLATLPHLPADISPSITSAYISNATIGVLDAWVLGQIDASPEGIVNHLMTLMPDWVSNPENPASTNQPS